MTSKFIYLAGPIADCTLNEATYWRDYVKERLADNIIGISPMREKGAEVAPDGKIPGNADQFKDTLMSNASAIYTRDRYDCTHADGIFCYLPRAFNERRPSYGTAIEIGWANGRDTPIILVSDDDYLTHHPIVTGCVGWIVDDLDKGIEVVNAIFGAYAPKVIAKPETLKYNSVVREGYYYPPQPPAPTPYPQGYAATTTYVVGGGNLGQVHTNGGIYNTIAGGTYALATQNAVHDILAEPGVEENTFDRDGPYRGNGGANWGQHTVGVDALNVGGQPGNIPTYEPGDGRNNN